MDNLSTMNKQRWDHMHVPEHNASAFAAAANRIKANKPIYDEIAKETNVPWWFIGVVHLRESNLKMDTYLGNGQPLDKKTTITPKGRGPFKSFKEGAIDAFKYCPPYAARNTDWSVGGALALLEKYNGMGYANKGIASPYIWAGTDQYSHGKYISDGVYDDNAVDLQLGCAGILKFLGVFNQAPVGSGTVAGAVVAGGVAATAASSAHWWTGFSGHWMAITLALIGMGLFVDLAIAIYKNEKNHVG
jgi:lysozyme family protein